MLRTHPQDHDSAFQAFVEMGRRIKEVKEIQLSGTSHKGPTVAYLFINKCRKFESMTRTGSFIWTFLKQEVILERGTRMKRSMATHCLCPTLIKNFKIPFGILKFKRNVINFLSQKMAKILTENIQFNK